MLPCWAALVLLWGQASATPGPTPAPTGRTCGARYTLISWGAGESKCLQLTASGSTFDECATAVCPKRGGHLACIGSADEFDAVHDAFAGKELKGGWPEGCAFVGQNRCNSKEEWEWTTTSCAAVDPEAVWQPGEPNDWAGAEDCGMVCDHITGGLNDGPCHNTVHCLCEERVARTEDVNYDNYDKGQCPEPIWGGLYVAAFLVGFFWCFSAGYGCCGIPRMRQHNAGRANGYCCLIVLFCIFLLNIWLHIIAAMFGMDPIIHVMAGIGDVVGFFVAYMWSRYTNENWYPPVPAPDPDAAGREQEIVTVQPPPVAPVAYGGEVIQGVVVRDTEVSQPEYASKSPHM